MQPSDWQPYRGERYLDFDAVDRHVNELAAIAPDWVSLERLGSSRMGRPLHLLTIGDRTQGNPDHRPAIWLDGGTHAIEWTGVMSALASVSRWVEGLVQGDPTLTEAFRQHTAYVAPCVSPDGLHETMHGRPSFRSTLRPPRVGTSRIGFEPHDIDGDGFVGWMRWRHPSGPWVADGGNLVLLRPRTVDDDPAEAFFLVPEGRFLQWDGVRYLDAPLELGLDLNRNFPVDWSPFSMFGMDAGDFPGSEPESRALLDAVAKRPHIAAAVTNHTYTGCLLCPPGRKDTPLSPGDVNHMHRLAKDLVRDTGYRVYKVYPEFMYDPDKPIIGTWDDTLSAVFGIAAFTLELWDPFAWAGLEPEDPTTMWRDPNHDRIRAVMDKIVAEGAARPWQAFEHPQLGPVELGGIDYHRTVRNPPEPLLRAECDRGHLVVDRLRRSLPQVTPSLTMRPLNDGIVEILVELENRGALATSGLQRAVTVGASPPVRVALHGADPVAGDRDQTLDHLSGWFRSGFGRSPVYPGLGLDSPRTAARFMVRSEDLANVRIEWWAGRAGRGVLTAKGK
ncbi:MAG: M14 family metallopeptidase [Myxococcota bacterium]